MKTTLTIIAALVLTGCVIINGKHAALTSKVITCEQSGATMDNGAGCGVTGSDIESALEAALTATVTP